MHIIIKIYFFPLMVSISVVDIKQTPDFVNHLLLSRDGVIYMNAFVDYIFKSGLRVSLVRRIL